MSYLEKLRDPRWQKKRLKVFEKADWKCELCGSANKELQVHHKKYIKNCEPWEYEMKYLISLCKNCHEKLSINKENNPDSNIETEKKPTNTIDFKTDYVDLRKYISSLPKEKQEKMNKDIKLREKRNKVKLQRFDLLKKMEDAEEKGDLKTLNIIAEKFKGLN